MNPKFLITDSETALKAVALNGMSFQFVLQHLRTEELALLAVGKNAHALKHVPVELRTEAVLLKAMESKVYVLPHIPEHAWSEALALKVVESHALDLKNIPVDFCTEAVVIKAVQGNGMALEHVPKHLFSQSLVDIAVANCDKVLKFSPPEFRSERESLRAGFPYRFDYVSSMQTLYGGMSITTCIVPTRWLDMALPTFDGSVVYTDKINRAEMDRQTDMVFRFTELDFDSVIHKITLDICHLEEGTDEEPLFRGDYFDAPITIHPRVIEFTDANWCIEVVLLNHLLAPWNATSVYEFCYYNIDDFLSALSVCTDFVFEFGIGNTPEDIIPPVLERLDGCEPQCITLTMFANNQSICEHSVTLTYCTDMIVSKFSNFAWDSYGVDQEVPEYAALPVFGDVGVKHEKMLISVLVGCEPTAPDFA